MKQNAFDKAASTLYYAGYHEGFEEATKEYETKSRMRLTLETRGFMMGLSVGILVLGPLLYGLVYVLFYTFIST